MGGTMRLGSYPCTLEEGTLAHSVYGETNIAERHRHRYEVNNVFRDALMKGGLTSPDCPLMVHWSRWWRSRSTLGFSDANFILSIGPDHSNPIPFLPTLLVHPRKGRRAKSAQEYRFRSGRHRALQSSADFPPFQLVLKSRSFLAGSCSHATFEPHGTHVDLQVSKGRQRWHPLQEHSPHLLPQPRKRSEGRLKAKITESNVSARKVTDHVSLEIAGLVGRLFTVVVPESDIV